MLLGIDDSSGISYFGDQRLPQREVVNPLIPVAFFNAEDKQISGPDAQGRTYAKLVFEEVGFDPLTNVRRGFVWGLYLDHQPQKWHIYFENGLSVSKRLVTYSRKTVSGIFSGRLPGKVSVTFGSSDQFSVGELVHVERQANGADMAVVIMRKQFSILPSVKTGSEFASQDDIARLSESLMKIEDGYRRSPPESVIDRCREACTVILQCFLKDYKHGEDLSALVKRYERSEAGRTMVSDLAHAISRLHARPKASEHLRDLPPVYERDAEMAVSAVGSILVALRWAVW